MEPVRTARSTWQAMSGNGLTIGTALPIIKVRHRRILLVQIRVNTECYGAVLRATIVAMCALPSATEAPLRMGTSSKVFVVR
jgi:hypothetical protein